MPHRAETCLGDGPNNRAWLAYEPKSLMVTLSERLKRSLSPIRPTPPSASPSPHQCLTIPYAARSIIRLQTPHRSTRLPQHTANPTRQPALERTQSCIRCQATFHFPFPFNSTGALSCEIIVDEIRLSQCLSGLYGADIFYVIRRL